MISLARYAALLRAPATRSLVAASVLGRLPIGITGLGILLLAQSATQSFAAGGGASACYVAGLAAAAPALGRWIDRRGPRPALLTAAVAFPAALFALIAAFETGAPLWVAFGLAAIAGASFPPITVCLRTYFRQHLGEDALLAAAYSLESVLIETIFVVGPMLVALCVALASPAAAVLAAAACGGAGTLLFLRTRALSNWKMAAPRPETSAEPGRNARRFGPLAQPGFASLLAVILCYASAFGLVEIAATAHAAEVGQPALAGVLLGVMSVGSALGGLAYGSRSWRLPLARQFPLTLALMGLGVAPLALALPEWLFALWCAVAGVAMAPALVMQSMLVARTAPPEHSTEAFTWSASGLLAGIGIGLGAGGQLLEFARSPAVFAAASAVSLVAALLGARLARA